MSITKQPNGRWRLDFYPKEKDERVSASENIYHQGEAIAMNVTF